MKITFLGTGGSLGVPVIGCKCEVCTSSKPENNRLRPSILITFEEKKILIDTSVDFRVQAIRHAITRLDAVLYTHAHADHILGIDDLRIVVERMQNQLPVYGSQETIDRLKKMFGYVFSQYIWRTKTERLKAYIIEEQFSVAGLEFIPVPVWHDIEKVTGFRFGNCAYITDVSAIPDQSLQKLKNLDILIFGALRNNAHPKHMSLDEVLETLESLSPQRAFLTHMSHDFDYDNFKDSLPEYIVPAYDGMEIIV